MTIKEREDRDELMAEQEFWKSRERFFNGIDPKDLIEPTETEWNKQYLKKLNERHRLGYNNMIK
jgi:hypothetical protein